MIYLDVDAAITVPVNISALIDDTDFKSREVAIAYDESGMDLVWNFIIPDGTITQTAVTPTTAGVYDWTHVGDGMYKIEIPASGGGSINNDTEGYGWFSGICDGVLPWRGPSVGFRASGLNDLLVESAFSATRGLSGTALPDAAADAIAGLPISDAGGLDLDAMNTAAVRLTAVRAAVLTDWIDGQRLDLIQDAIKVPTDKMVFTTANKLDSRVDNWAGTSVSAGVGGDGLPASIALSDRNAYLIESLQSGHTYQGNHFYLDPVNGDTHASGNRGGRTDPYKTLQDCHDNAITDSNHDIIFLVAGHASTVTTHTIAGTTTLSKRYFDIRGPGRDFIITRTGSGDTLAITGDGIALSGFQLGTAATGSGNGIKVTDADFTKVEHVWILDTQGDGVHILRGSNCIARECVFSGTGVGGSGDGIHIVGTSGVSTNNIIKENVFSETAGDSILIEQGTTNDTLILKNLIHDSGGWAINIGASSTDAIVHGNIFGNNASGNITDAGTTTIDHHNRDWLSATVEGRTLDIAATGEAGVDLGNVTGTLGNANVGWIDGNDRTDVGSWLGTAVTVSATTALPEVDMKSISDDAAAANNCELFFDGTGYDAANSTIGTCTTNTDMRGTDSAFLAASAPTNFSALVISAGGAADVLVQGFLNNTIAETTADNIANNFEVFFDNGDSTSTSIIDDVENLNGTVGVAGAGLTAINLPNQTMDITGNITGNLSGSVGSVTTKTGYSLVSTGLDSVMIDGVTLPGSMQLMAAVTLGKITGAGTGTEVFIGIDDSTTRVTVTVDGSGNRSAVTKV